ncbi:GMC family oxidoreductase [Frateuria aurantia]|uniref:Choline dehydrogenase-like flavoprotein n=1 Tax=Frateuria aurantia (strain ATCC 33424 / DSM 6220 / KCTC 2777 / LMG 1558 / NBRC 3245 / NCIMB 13370) TaxID=767434 RepID=H8L1Q1_FRAAD|nr:GMC family oxidoreductase [Frateuria aurantia]AFC85411.1 choline dehydrogenase-like flavoprotein [Frateuria aurantia DSM 6220]
MAVQQQYDADAIVVGSGLIGSVAAHNLARQGKSVIQLEAGPRVPRWKIVEGFRNSGNASSNGGNRNQPYPNEPWARTSFTPGYIENTGPVEYIPGMLRLVGGTTWHWGGACWRILPNDFKLKSLYGVGRDWPISYEDLEPFYSRVEIEMGVSGDDHADYSGHNGAPYPPRSVPFPVRPQELSYLSQRFAARVAEGGYPFTYQPNGRATDPYGERPACVGNNNCSPICPIGAQYSGDRHATMAERAGARLIPNAVAYKIEKGPDGKKIVAIHYYDQDGKSHRLTARYFVIAAHAIETPRLLLLSDVANSSDMVGRNLMDHNAFSLSMLADEPLWSGRGPVQQGDVLRWRDGDFRRQHGAIRYEVGNFVGNVPITRRLLEQGVMGPELDKQIRHMAARFISVSSNIESLPDPANRVSLHAHNRDKFGLPQLSINYDVSAYVRAGGEVVKQDFLNFQKLLGAEVFEKNISVWENRDHPMGTVIMGENPRDSVVNHECRTHDHDNLFLATTGVMPAAQAFNPTMTGAALAMRSTDIIAREI